MVNLTNVLVDMCLNNILVKKIGYLFNQCDWFNLNHLGLVNLTNILVDMCLTNILVNYIDWLFVLPMWLVTILTNSDWSI